MNLSLIKPDLAVALSKAQGEFTAVPKNGFNPHFKSHFAELADVIAMATPVLSKNGLSVLQFPEVEDGRDILTIIIMHSSGDWVTSSMPLYMGQASPQVQGSAISYGRRYQYCAALGIVADDDDDGNAASHATQTTRPAPQRNPYQKQPQDRPQPAPSEETGEIPDGYVTWTYALKAIAGHMHTDLREANEWLTAKVGVQAPNVKRTVLDELDAPMAQVLPLQEKARAVQQRTRPSPALTD